jgi:excisionase family DNA binding protein
MKNKPLTIKEAAKFTGYCRSYIYQLVNMGKIPYHKPNGGRLFFKASELEDFIYSGRKYSNSEISKKADELLNERKRRG